MRVRSADYGTHSTRRARRRQQPMPSSEARYGREGSFCPGPRRALLAFANWRLSGRELPSGPARRRVQVLPAATGHFLPFHESRNPGARPGFPGAEAPSYLPRVSRSMAGSASLGAWRARFMARLPERIIRVKVVQIFEIRRIAGSKGEIAIVPIEYKHSLHRLFADCG